MHLSTRSVMHNSRTRSFTDVHPFIGFPRVPLVQATPGFLDDERVRTHDLKHCNGIASQRANLSRLAYIEDIQPKLFSAGTLLLCKRVATTRRVPS